MARALERERKRRAAAEQLLEEKSRDLYLSYKELETAHAALRQNKDQLVQTEKMASLGVMSAGIAHEINNPIGFVQSNLNTLVENVPIFSRCISIAQALIKHRACADETARYVDELDSLFEAEDIAFVMEDARDILKESQEGIGRVGDIVAGLKAFARTDSGAFADVDVNECLASTLNLARPHLKHHCEIREELTGVPLITGNAGRLGQVFMNLIVNASQALAEQDGRIELRTSLRDGYVVVEVEDNGCGISTENQRKLFEPFFTTKPVGEGTGLGLSISLGIIEEHQGHLRCASSAGEGTVMTVELPVGS